MTSSIKDGIFHIPLELPWSSPGFVNVYLIDDTDGFVMIDCGVNGDHYYELLSKKLGEINIGFNEIKLLNNKTGESIELTEINTELGGSMHYIAKITDPNEYDTYLVEALAAALAADLAYAITNNATLAKNYEATADERLREARFIDATENSLGTIESSEFTDARL